MYGSRDITKESFKNIESIVRKQEEHEAELDEKVKRIYSRENTQSTGIGVANDLIRFLYTLEKQRQRDPNGTYIEAENQVRSYLKLDEEDDDEEVVDDVEEDNDVTTDIPPEETPLVQSSPSDPKSQSVIFNPSPPSTVETKNTSLESFANPQLPEPASEPDSLAASYHIKDDTRKNYENLLLTTQEYERRYSKVELERKKTLKPWFTALLNKLRKDSYNDLTRDLVEFLQGQEKKSLNQRIRIHTEDERLLCLSILASLILEQLFGGDFNQTKAEVFLPLIQELSGNPQQPEFRKIFIGRLHQKCPYTVPMFPKKLPDMSDEEFLKALGYCEKNDGTHVRLENENEFLNRMSGFIRLFCKMLETGCPPFDQDMQFVWKWFSDVLNLPPQENLTCVVIRIFLEEAAEIMMRRFERSFFKLLNTIGQKYMPKLQQQTSDDQITRLQITLDKLLK